MAESEKELRALNSKVHAPLAAAAQPGATALVATSPLAITTSRVGQFVAIVNDEVIGYFATAAAANTAVAQYPATSGLVWQVGVPRGIAPIHPH